jgi:MarR family transcriptional regulator, organic hydroperoxide resistance regulator
MKTEKEDNETTAQLDKQIDQVKTFFVEFTKKVLSLNSLNGSSKESDFNLSQIKTLSAFKEDRDYTMGELSKNMGVATPRTTLLVDDLEKTGIVQRVRDKNDRRIVKVRLTVKGKTIRKKFNQQRRQETEILLLRFSKKDRLELLDAMDRITKTLQKLT